MHSILNFTRQTRYFQITPFTIPFFFYFLLILVNFCFWNRYFFKSKSWIYPIATFAKRYFSEFDFDAFVLVQKPLKSSMLGMNSKKIWPAEHASVAFSKTCFKRDMNGVMSISVASLALAKISSTAFSVNCPVSLVYHKFYCHTF